MNEHLTMRDVVTAVAYASIAGALVTAVTGIAFIVMIWSIII